jgi:hypothetical protein
VTYSSRDEDLAANSFEQQLFHKLLTARIPAVSDPINAHSGFIIFPAMNQRIRRFAARVPNAVHPFQSLAPSTAAEIRVMQNLSHPQAN